MNYLASILIGITTFFGGIFNHTPSSSQYDGSNPVNTIHLGSTGFPTAIDTTTNLPNPGATDSVATVSHSALHTNENLAIIASETKLGIGASTPTNNTIFVGNGVGSSAFSSSATSSNFLATNFTTASSTMGSTSVQTLLAGQATSTNLYVSNNLSTLGTASSTTLNANSSSIGTLTVGSCVGCSSNSSVSTTSLQVLATTTLSGIPSSSVINFLFHSTSTVAITTGKTVAGIDTQLCIFFNNFSSTGSTYVYDSNYQSQSSVGGQSVTDNKLCATSANGAGQGSELTAQGTIMNSAGFWKYGFVHIRHLSNAGAIWQTNTYFVWKDTTQISSLNFSTGSTTAGYATSTFISVF